MVQTVIRPLKMGKNCKPFTVYLLPQLLDLISPSSCLLQRMLVMFTAVQWKHCVTHTQSLTPIQRPPPPKQLHPHFRVHNNRTSYYTVFWYKAMNCGELTAVIQRILTEFVHLSNYLFITLANTCNCTKRLPESKFYTYQEYSMDQKADII